MKNYKTINDFLDKGIYQTKIIEVKLPSVIWSLTKKRVVQYPETYELITDKDGNNKISIENNRVINVISYSELTSDIVNQINESEGIVVYPIGEHFRFNFIPTK